MGDFMKLLKKYATFFLIGSIGYGIIELLWRRRTHFTMLLAGGICFILFSLIAEKQKTKPLAIKAALTALCITAVELIFGVIFNIILKMQVWDYSAQPLNLFGQICPLYTLLWGILALIFLPIADLINRRLEHRLAE